MAQDFLLLGFFVVAENKFEVRFLKFKMTDLLWRTSDSFSATQKTPGPEILSHQTGFRGTQNMFLEAVRHVGSIILIFENLI